LKDTFDLCIALMKNVEMLKLVRQGKMKNVEMLKWKIRVGGGGL